MTPEIHIPCLALGEFEMTSYSVPLFLVTSLESVEIPGLIK